MAIDLVLNDIEKAAGFEGVVRIKVNGPNAKPIPDIWAAFCKTDKDVRKAAESKHVDLLIGLEEVEVKDSLHNRNSGMNEVICKLANKNNIAIAFSFSKILHSKVKPLLLGRMMQNVGLCRKYKVRMLIASFAETKWDLRSYNELFSFGITLGMTPKEVKDALETAEVILQEKKQEKLPAGIRRVR